MTRYLLVPALLLAAVSLSPAADITGQYVEARTCDVYTGPCFANAEMGLAGREAILAWSVREGSWNGAKLNGLRVLAVVKADGTLGDVCHDGRHGTAVLIVDERADHQQRQALAGLAVRLAGSLVERVVRVEAAPIEMEVHPKSCPANGCSRVCAARRLSSRLSTTGLAMPTAPSRGRAATAPTTTTPADGPSTAAPCNSATSC